MTITQEAAALTERLLAANALLTRWGAAEEPLVMVLHAAVLVAFAAIGAYAATRTFRQKLVRG